MIDIVVVIFVERCPSTAQRIPDINVLFGERTIWFDNLGFEASNLCLVSFCPPECPLLMLRLGNWIQRGESNKEMTSLLFFTIAECTCKVRLEKNRIQQNAIVRAVNSLKGGHARDQLRLSALERCPPWREMKYMTDVRQGLTPCFRFREVSALTRYPLRGGWPYKLEARNRSFYRRVLNLNLKKIGVRLVKYTRSSFIGLTSGLPKVICSKPTLNPRVEIVDLMTWRRF